MPGAAAARAACRGTHLRYGTPQFVGSGLKALGGQVPQPLPRPGEAVVLREAVLAQVGQRAGARSTAGRLPLGRSLLVGVPEAQMRRADPLDLIRCGHLQHSQHTQHITAEVVRRAHRIRFPLPRHQPRPSTTDIPTKFMRREEGCNDAAGGRICGVSRAFSLSPSVRPQRGLPSSIRSGHHRGTLRPTRRWSASSPGRAHRGPAKTPGNGACPATVNGLPGSVDSACKRRHLDGHRAGRASW